MHVAASTQVEVLAVLDQWQVQRPAILHGPSNHSCIHHRPAVIRDRDSAGPLHGSNSREFFASTALRDCSDRVHTHNRVSIGLFADIAGNCGVVVNRLRIGHTADGRETACGRGPRSALDGFSVLKARFAEVNVDVDETRSNNLARGVEPLASSWVLNVRADLTNDPVLDRNVTDAVQVFHRIYYPAALNQE